MVVIASLSYMFFAKKPEIRRSFIKALIASVAAVFCSILILPLLHQNDNCQIYYRCDANELCPAIYSSSVTCFYMVDVFPLILLLISLIFTIFGLIKSKKMHCKIWPYFAILPFSFILTIPFSYIVSLLTT